MGWHGHLHLNYTRDGERTIALDRHDGPLRVLLRLYPEATRSATMCWCTRQGHRRR
jgi:urease accessory protein UreH